MPLFKKDKKEKEKSASEDGSAASTVERSSKLTPEQVEGFGAPLYEHVTALYFHYTVLYSWIILEYSCLENINLEILAQLSVEANSN